MHENKFERDVQGKLEGMRMMPSAPVWAEVEARIRQQRKKRRIFFFWLLSPLLLLGGASAWWLLHPQQESGPARPVATVAAPAHSRNSGTAVPDVASGPTAPAHPITRADASTPVTALIPPDVPASSPVRSYIGNADDVPEKGYGSEPATAQERVARIFGKKKRDFRNPSRTGNEAGALPRETTGENTPGRQTDPPVAPATEKGIAAAPVRTTPPLLPVAAASDSTLKKTVAAVENPKDSLQAAAAPAEAPKAHKKRLQWALEGSAMAALPAGAGGAQSVALNYAASDNTNWQGGALYQLGARVLLPLPGRLRLVTGLDLGLWHLTYNRDSLAVLRTSSGGGNPFGGPVAASQDGTKTGASYTVLSVQLPVQLQWQPAPRLPLTLSGGFSVAHLLSALPDDVRSRSQLSLLAGARYRLARIGRHAIELGPQASFGLSRFTGNQRLVQAGAAVRFSF